MLAAEQFASFHQGNTWPAPTGGCYYCTTETQKEQRAWHTQREGWEIQCKEQQNRVAHTQGKKNHAIGKGHRTTTRKTCRGGRKRTVRKGSAPGIEKGVQKGGDDKVLDTPSLISTTR
jgi:hypothetical protein